MAIDLSRDRSKTLGGSDMGTIMRVNPYNTPIDLWLQKTGKVEAPDLSKKPEVIWGNLEEPIILSYYEQLHNVKLTRDVHIRVEGSPLVANLDALDEENKMVIEVKTAKARVFLNSWGDPEKHPEFGYLWNPREEVPNTYMCQIQFYMWRAGAEKGVLVLKADSSTYVEYPIKRNDALIEQMLQAAMDFWECVDKNIKPQSKTFSEAMKLWVPMPTAKPQLMLLEDEMAYEIIMDLKKTIKECEEEIDQNKYLLMKKLEESGNNALMYKDYKALTCSIDKNGSRRFRLNVKGEEEGIS